MKRLRLHEERMSGDDGVIVRFLCGWHVVVVVEAVVEAVRNMMCFYSSSRLQAHRAQKSPFSRLKANFWVMQNIAVCRERFCLLHQTCVPYHHDRRFIPKERE